MKIIKNKEKNGNYYFSAYQLNQCFCPHEKHAGLLILYTLVNSKMLFVREIVLDYMSDLHDGNVKQIYEKDEFIKKYPAFEEFYRDIDIENMAPWQVELEDDTIINGGFDQEVRIMYENDAINFNKLFFNIEEETYQYSDCSSEAIAYLMTSEGVGRKIAVQLLQGLFRQEDLYQELVSNIKGGQYSFPDKLITVEGYTVKRLVEEVGLHPIGAYSSLVHLREAPEKALENIKRGIIRK